MPSPIRSALTLVGLAVTLYVWFFVPLGRRTLHEHALRIADTAPAQDLRDEVREATDRATAHVEEEWRRRYGDASHPDAGIAP